MSNLTVEVANTLALPGITATDPPLVLLCGLPGAGKTTLSHMAPALRGRKKLSADAIRCFLAMMIEGREHERADYDGYIEPLTHHVERVVRRHLLMLGAPVVVDRCFLTRLQREDYISSAQEADVRIGIVHIQTTLEEAIASDATRGVPQGREIIERYWRSREPPGEREGFDPLLRVRLPRLLGGGKGSE